MSEIIQHSHFSALRCFDIMMALMKQKCEDRACFLFVSTSRRLGFGTIGGEEKENEETDSFLKTRQRVQYTGSAFCRIAKEHELVSFYYGRTGFNKRG